MSLYIVQNKFIYFHFFYCVALCPLKEIPGQGIKPICKRNRRTILCSDDLLPGTIATIHCRSGYVEPAYIVNRKLTCLESGQWSHQALQCEADCGVVMDSTTLMHGGL